MNPQQRNSNELIHGLLNLGPHAIPAALQPPAMQVTPDMLMILLGCMLEEQNKALPELKAALEALIAERHNHFHVKPSKTTADDRDWRKCNNPICRDMVTIIDRAAVNEAVITQFQFERIRLSKAIMLQPMHGKLRVYMQEADEVKAEAARIILP